MSRKPKSPHPEIYCDFNGRMTERGFLPTQGTFRDLAALGLTIEEAVGRTFVFVMGDADEHGNPDDLMCNGSIIRESQFGILLEMDAEGFYWRSELAND